MSRIDRFIDRFVEKVNVEGQKPLWTTDIPPSMPVGPRNRFGICEWQIQRGGDDNWIRAVEAKLPARFPPAFRSLVTRYTFPMFEVGELSIFSNTRQEQGVGSDELPVAIFKDKVLSRALLSSGYVQFARPSGGSYDAICFDTKRRSGIGEYPITWIDHEGIFCYDEIRIVKEVADSFHQFIEAFLGVAP